VKLGFSFMARVVFFIDGFNLFHALDYFPSGSNPARFHRFKWISLRRLAMCFLTKRNSLEGVLYFTTLATWDPAKVARHRLFIRAQENEGVEVVYGEFKRKDKRCLICGKRFWTYEEKQTDVNIALRLFQNAVLNRYDRAVIVSGDTDLIPAVDAVRSTFPGKALGVLLPIGRASEHFKQIADFHYKMKERHLATARLPDALTLRDGTILHCPPRWR
jgi:uncharacterized LabA/DUF88 family protein